MPRNYCRQICTRIQCQINSFGFSKHCLGKDLHELTVCIHRNRCPCTIHGRTQDATEPNRDDHMKSGKNPWWTETPSIFLQSETTQAKQFQFEHLRVQQLLNRFGSISLWEQLCLKSSAKTCSAHLSCLQRATPTCSDNFTVNTRTDLNFHHPCAKLQRPHHAVVDQRQF